MANDDRKTFGSGLDTTFLEQDRLRKKGILTNVNIETSNGGVVKAHKLMLICAFPELQETLGTTTNETTTLTWSRFSHSTVDAVVSFAYTGKISLSSKSVRHVLFLACCLRCETLINYCVKYLTPGFKQRDEAVMWNLYKGSNALSLMELSLSLWMEDVNSFIKEDKFLSLDARELHRLLRHPQFLEWKSTVSATGTGEAMEDYEKDDQRFFDTNSETKKLEAIVRWINHSDSTGGPNPRVADFEHLLSQVGMFQIERDEMLRFLAGENPFCYNREVRMVLRKKWEESLGKIYLLGNGTLTQLNGKLNLPLEIKTIKSVAVCSDTVFIQSNDSAQSLFFIQPSSGRSGVVDQQGKNLSYCAMTASPTSLYCMSGSQCREYDTVANTWKNRPGFGFGMQHSSVLYLPNNVLLALGGHYNSNQPSTTVSMLYLNNGKAGWRSLANMTTACTSPTTAYHNRYVIVSTGYNFQVLRIPQNFGDIYSTMWSTVEYGTIFSGVTPRSLISFGDNLVAVCYRNNSTDHTAYAEAKCMVLPLRNGNIWQVVANWEVYCETKTSGWYFAVGLP